MKATIIATTLLALTAPFAAAVNSKTYGPVAAFKDSWISLRADAAAFNTPVPPLNITLQVAVANAWDEATVNGDNKPGFLGNEFTFYVEDTKQPIKINATEQCKIAAAKGTGFSLFVSSPKAPYEFKSRETGMGATLVATVSNWA
ncbi:hypothetical protein DL89DRAFT_290701 [Linderina pennispora]|uniref:Carbohydrate-binding module family 96 domain-containing protein n=1 Tax=Linderina pennispora TaxID=61395 RepID=A0A1Y1WH91_9FUNG|nr:uncharacterized protein DL89DRAFT_290701 [Linderina pennispora]ORX72889.1 hypothetical protein DL89DRAFT_290701 [Linderina pennispora]